MKTEDHGKSLCVGRGTGGQRPPGGRLEFDREVGLDAVLLQRGADLAVIGDAKIDIGVEIEIEPGLDDGGSLRQGRTGHSEG